MSSGFEVVPASVAEAAEHAHRAAATVRPLDLRGPLVGITKGMPGGASAGAAALLGDEWAQRVSRWAEDAHGDRLRDAVQTYRGGQSSAANKLGLAVR
ncbi:MAG TPA: hypothetical protein VG674_00120 [Amycolatopsis sp.]|nr:hypothetical protein [Amycolatopsis sp.]